MFKIGERVIHPTQGVGIIKAIENRDVDGRNIPLYAIKLLKQGSGNLKLMIPVNGSEGRKLRYPIQAEEIPKVLDILSSPEGEESPSDYQERFTVIREKLKSSVPHQLAELIRGLDGMKDLSASEKSLLCSEVTPVGNGRENRGFIESKEESMPSKEGAMTTLERIEKGKLHLKRD